MFCENCGAEMQNGQAFCSQCGHTAGEPAKAPQTAQIRASHQSTTAAPKKSKLTAGLLGIFFGWLGIHNFYLGYTKKAILQLILGTVGMIVLVGPIISEIWGLIEGIMLLTGRIAIDGKGNSLKN